MILLATDIQTNIANALLDLSLEYPSRSDFSMDEIAVRAGMTRQDLYQQHFRSNREIVEYLRQTMGTEINALFQQYNPATGQNPLDYFVNNILPMLYKNRKLIRCFCTTEIDPTWRPFIQKIYLEWGLNNYNTSGNAYHLSDRAMTKLFVKSTMAIVEAWLCQEDPAPIEEFRTDFLRLTKTPIYELLTVKTS